MGLGRHGAVLPRWKQNIARAGARRLQHRLESRADYRSRLPVVNDKRLAGIEVVSASAQLLNAHVAHQAPYKADRFGDHCGDARVVILIDDDRHKGQSDALPAVLVDQFRGGIGGLVGSWTEGATMPGLE